MHEYFETERIKKKAEKRKRWMKSKFGKNEKKNEFSFFPHTHKKKARWGDNTFDLKTTR
tara:strand:- start:304 stop:480 length:177 start_codon:yes stop_codon:yes gene_type:complete